ncbi:MAG: sialidase family protein, partial [Nitrososphaera sp.]
MDFGEIVSISNDSSFYATPPFVAFSYKSNSLYVIWQKTRGIYGNVEHFKGQKKSASIVCRISKDSGRTFGDIMTLHDFREPGIFPPRVAFSPLNENRVFLAWADKSSPTKLDVYFTRNSESGDRFEEPIIVSDEKTGVCSSEGSNDLRNFLSHGQPSETYDVVIPYIAAGNDNNVYVMWVESTTTKKMSEAALPEPQDKQAAASISFGQGEIDKAAKYMEDQIRKSLERAPKYRFSVRVFLRGSNDGGKTFGRKISLIEASFDGQGGPQVISPTDLHAIGKNVYVIVNPLGRDPDNARVRIFASTDMGQTFEERTGLSKTVSSIGSKIISARAEVASKQHDSLHLLLEVASHDDEEKILFPTPFSFPRAPLIFVKSMDAGKTFGDPVHVGINGPISTHSSFAVSPDGNKVHVAYVNMDDPMKGVYDVMKKGTLRGARQIDQMFKESDSGYVFVRSSSNGGISFDELTKLEDSKNTAPILSFATYILLLPQDRELYA